MEAIDDLPATVPQNACATPFEGCPCDTDLQTTPCGVVKDKTNDYAVCQYGARTCRAGVWGACSTNGETSTQALPGKGGSGRRALGLGSISSCASPNLCDPFCKSITDDATGLTLDPVNGVKSTPTGLQLIPHERPPALACAQLTVTPSPAALTITSLSPISPSAIQLTAALGVTVS